MSKKALEFRVVSLYWYDSIVIPVKTLFKIIIYIQLLYFKNLFDFVELKELWNIL